MRPVKIPLALLGVLLLFTPRLVRAQNCLLPTAIQCGDSISGNSFSMSVGLSSYSCLPGNQASEVSYLLTLASETEVTVRLTPTEAWNPMLALLPETAGGGDCDPQQCISGASSGYPRTVSGMLSPGNYYIVVDGTGDILDFGDFDLTVSCLTCDDCLDDDGDGYFGYDPESCFCGEDCCDSGSEDSPGCDSATRASIHPGAREVCGDDIDQDCDGIDPLCPDCGSDAVLLCEDLGTASTTDGLAGLSDYCGLGQESWGANEFIFEITPQTSSAVEFTIDNLAGQQLDLFALPNYGLLDVCNPESCLDVSMEETGTQRVVFFTRAGESYFIAVDGRDGAQGSFDYSASCVTEECTADDVLVCGSEITGDNGNGTASLSVYPEVAGRRLGPEYIYRLTTGDDAHISLTLNIDDGGATPPDLALLVLEEDPDGACRPAYLVAYSDLVQDGDHNPAETLGFIAAAGTTYFVVVDGLLADSSGAYTLRTDCDLDCADSQTPCENSCVDLDIDPSNCGFCGNACAFDHASAQCVGGHCVLGNCHSGWGDCNGDGSDGCETRLGTVDDCAGCGDTCYFLHAEPWCENQECLLLSCHQGWGNCNGDTGDGCEADLNTREYCGSCDNTCVAPQVCHDGSCLDECPAGLTDCDGSCADTDSNPSHCGACNQECTVANGVAACETGGCVVAECLPGYGDCVNGYDDGCETDLTSPENCGECGHACSFEHASALCSGGSCMMGDCTPPWENCNYDSSDGCEINLDTSPENCGECANTCPDDQSCVSGECSFQCLDNDGDGHPDADCGGDDCNDFNPGIYPGAPETCGDGVDQDCDGEDLECICSDEDGDGYTSEDCGGEDCDDSNGFVNPKAEEICGDGVDQDCDGEDLACDCQDADGDGFPDVTCGGNDCDDDDQFVYPGAYDACGDGIDSDCDGRDPECDQGCGCQTHRPGSRFLLFGLAWLLVCRRRKEPA